jgi:outer membrane protein OmpA-like peptidoglycan-associated protein
MFCRDFSVNKDSADEEEVYYDELEELRKSEYFPRIAVFLNYGINIQHADFYELPGFPTCCNSFGNGFGSGFNFGLLGQLRFDEHWFAGAKLTFGNLNGVFESEQHKPITIVGALQDALICNTLDASINTFAISPFVSYMLPQITDNLYVTAGLDVATILSSNFAQYEELVSPEIGTFENGTRIRNYVSDKLPNTNPFLFGANIGTYWELPINKLKNIRISPEINYHLWLNSPVKDLSWNTSQITFGISVKYNKEPVPPPPPDAPTLPNLPELPLPVHNTNFVATVTHKILNDSNGIEEGDITIEDFTQSTLKPLLNYVFFDNNSSKLPERYHLSNDRADTFDISHLKSQNALATYYYCLDIIGSRMKATPEATLELVGTNCDKGAEHNNTALSKARAETIKKYLCDHWNIASNRISIKARNLPKEPTKSVEDGGLDENMRVEIYSNVSSITEPIMSYDTFSIIKNKRISFYPSVTSQYGIANSKLTVTQGDSLINEWNVNGALPATIDWNLADSNFTHPSKRNFHYQLTATDKIGQSVKSAQNTIIQKRITIDAKRKRGYPNDTEFEYYSLILFDFASNKLYERHNKVLNFIISKIRPEAKVIVSGYADVLGLPEANKRIAAQRATETAKRLGIPDVEIRSIGNDELLYDNTYPEGRFYCRTVTIYIETPISN